MPDEHEINQKQLLQALKQPLFIQTPLQAVLEHVLTKLQAQTELLGDLSTKVARLQRVHVESSELLLRVQTVERRVDAAAGLSSPMGITDLAKRLTVIEGKTETLEEEVLQQQMKGTKDVDPRLAVLEERMKGVHNLAGHIMAVSDMAEELGIDIPQEPPSWGGAAEDGAAAAEIAALAAGGGGSGSSSSSTATDQSGQASSRRGRRNNPPAAAAAAPAAAGGAVERPPSAAQAAPGVVAAERRPSSGGRGARAKAQQEWQEKVEAQIAALQKQMKGLEEQVADAKLQAGSATMDTQVAAAQARQALAHLRMEWREGQAEVKGHLQQLQEEVAKPPEISLADFCLLESTVQGAVKDVHRALADTKALQDKDIPALTQALVHLEQQVAAQGGVSDMERHLAGQIAELQGVVEGVQQRIDEAQVADMAQQGLATQEDVQELMGLMRTKASQQDLRSVLARSVELALSAYREATGDDAGASKSRCLVCDRQLRPPSPRPGSPGSPHQVPLLDSFVPGQGPGGQGLMGAGFNAAEMRRQRAASPPGSSHRPFSGAFRSNQWSPTDDTQAADAGGQDGPTSSSTADADAQQYARAHTPGSPGTTVRYSNTPAYNSKGQRLHSSNGRGAVAFNLAALPGELPRPQTAAASSGGAGGRGGVGSSGGFTGRSARTKRPQTSSGQPRNPIFL